VARHVVNVILSFEEVEKHVVNVILSFEKKVWGNYGTESFSQKISKEANRIKNQQSRTSRFFLYKSPLAAWNKDKEEEEDAGLRYGDHETICSLAWGTSPWMRSFNLPARLPLVVSRFSGLLQVLGHSVSSCVGDRDASLLLFYLASPIIQL
jgi:hypothetical protein